MVAMDEQLDPLLQTVAILGPLLDKEGEKDYENHLLGWSGYCEGLKEIACEVISIIRAGNVSQVEKSKMFGGHKKVTELANPSDKEVERSKEFKLCDTAEPAKNSSVMHDEMDNETCGVMYAEMYNEMCSTVFNRERRTEYNICKQVYIQQCDTYAFAVKQCMPLNLGGQEGGDSNGQPVDVGGGPGGGGGGGAAPPAAVTPTGDEQSDSLTCPLIQISQVLTAPTVMTTSAQSSNTSTVSVPVPVPASSTATVMRGGVPQSYTDTNLGLATKSIVCDITEMEVTGALQA